MTESIPDDLTVLREIVADLRRALDARHLIWEQDQERIRQAEGRANRYAKLSLTYQAAWLRLSQLMRDYSEAVTTEQRTELRARMFDQWTAEDIGAPLLAVITAAVALRDAVRADDIGHQCEAEQALLAAVERMEGAKGIGG